MLGNLTSVINLYMEQNMFSESIPLSLANCQNLQLLNLSSNNLTGTMPKKLFTLSSLTISLSMSNNFLTGSLPSEVGDLVNLAELDVSGNKLSGTIPESPYSFKRLGIDVSSNNLSGKIPDFLGKFRALNHLNLSYNDFEGELPTDGSFQMLVVTQFLEIIGSVVASHNYFYLHACAESLIHLKEFLRQKK
ncbi:hypothetical protein Pyn_40338 [Prunus yedoensis var. nudiflora]|uniref:LRR receptor-like serine/threonine-protein kinase n=1 Tax=Prunus yedoensis var. nudiflora TaxID=2094558 RepID=A0A314ZF61_PRUYE|nr:hypothetical protein Pyn_40338 [Prunus yedoensis var. nudiflora]